MMFFFPDFSVPEFADTTPNQNSCEWRIVGNRIGVKSKVASDDDRFLFFRIDISIPDTLSDTDLLVFRGRYDYLNHALNSKKLHKLSRMHFLLSLTLLISEVVVITVRSFLARTTNFGARFLYLIADSRNPLL